MTAVRRVLLVRHGGTAATRRADFPGDEPLSPAGRRTAAALGPLLAGAGTVVTSPALRAVETAAAAELDAAVEPLLRPLDAGRWAGCRLAELQYSDPAGMAAWLTDPDARPHGGETLVELAARVRDLLAVWHAGPAGDVVAVTHAAVVRAAVVVALDAPPLALWRVEAAPGSVTELHSRGAGWVVYRSNAAAPA